MRCEGQCEVVTLTCEQVIGQTDGTHQMGNYIDTGACMKHSLLWLHATEAGVFISSSSNATIDRPTATAINLVPQDMLVVRTRKYLLTS